MCVCVNQAASSFSLPASARSLLNSIATSSAHAFACIKRQSRLAPACDHGTIQESCTT